MKDWRPKLALLEYNQRLLKTCQFVLCFQFLISHRKPTVQIQGSTDASSEDKSVQN
jgi:hypothetical protein